MASQSSWIVARKFSTLAARVINVQDGIDRRTEIYFAAIQKFYEPLAAGLKQTSFFYIQIAAIKGSALDPSIVPVSLLFRCHKQRVVSSKLCVI